MTTIQTHAPRIGGVDIYTWRAIPAPKEPDLERLGGYCVIAGEYEEADVWIEVTAEHPKEVAEFIVEAVQTVAEIKPLPEGIVAETVARIVLHCSRCNTVFKDESYDSTVLWTHEELFDHAFPKDFSESDEVQGWIRIGNRILCHSCWEYKNEDTDDEERIEVSDS